MHAREHRNLVRIALKHDWRRVHLHRPAPPQKVCKRKQLGALPAAPCALALRSPVTMSQGLQAPGSGSLDLQCACRVQIAKLNLHPTSIQARAGSTRGKAGGQISGPVAFCLGLSRRTPGGAGLLRPLLRGRPRPRTTPAPAAAACSGRTVLTRAMRTAGAPKHVCRLPHATHTNP